jgi:hypothetical protein
MSTEPFRIDHHWSPEAAGEPEPVRDPSPLWRAMRRFIGTRRGGFTLHVGALPLAFDLAPDLSTIFAELPGVLEHLASGAPGPVELDFFEPGSGLALELERDCDAIRIRPRRGDGIGARFRGLAEDEHRVPAREFLCAWGAFLGAVLDALAADDATLSAGPELGAYRRRIQGVCAA